MMETVSTENEPISILTNILEKENYGDSDKKITRWKRLACDKYEGKIVVGIVKSVRKRDGVSLWEDDNHVAKKGKSRDMSISPEISMEQLFTKSGVAQIIRDLMGRLTSQLEKWNRVKKKAKNEDLCALRKELAGLYGGVMSKVVGRQIKIIENMIDRLLETDELY
ncbi:hypothetical protein QYF36_024267 [Acer negundo]|nr:hypothetical protein QYF36_024267 [Acer negundo]